MSEHDANRGLADTARLNVEALRHDPMEDTQRMPICHRRDRAWEGNMMHAETRERRKPSTVGQREPKLADSDPAGHRQAFVDYLSDQEQRK